jgi:excisionase family DNA binding protein
VDAKLTSERLQRKAIVYVRQSSMVQVTHNLESQRRQYNLDTRAQELGFHEIEVIDEDLGRSGSGCVDRPGFEHLVAQVCTGAVGGVICVEASRLARNGRDWHRLIELCALFNTVIIDPEGIYDPNLTNDRLLLGLKGTMSEFELTLIRQRSREAINQKANRGELHFRLPSGLCWNGDHIELDPDQHIQQVLRLVFQKMEELGSARQIFLWFHREQLCVPVRGVDGKVIWKMPGRGTILAILSNPFYAGAYAFGRAKTRTRVVDGHARKNKERRRHPQDWQVLIRNHHPGYITWEQFENNLRIIDANTHMKSQIQTKAGRGGRALLAGLLRCRRCGRILKVHYTSSGERVSRYACRGGPRDNPDCMGVGFGGLKADTMVVQQMLAAVSGNAIEAALQAAEQERMKQGAHRRSLELGLQQARYQAGLAERRYLAVDPAQRLVASELEARWNVALERVQEAEAKCAEYDRRMETTGIPSKESLVSLAQDLPEVWKTSTDMRLKQRIVHLVLREIIADVDPVSYKVTLLLHWAGGRHSEVCWTKNPIGFQGRPDMGISAEEVIGKMAAEHRDKEIADTLNRQRGRAEPLRGWTEQRVAQTRKELNLPEFRDAGLAARTMTLEQAAKRLQVGVSTVRRLIDQGVLIARQAAGCAPWKIEPAALDSEPVRRAIGSIAPRSGRKRTSRDDRQQHIFSGLAEE